MFSSNPYNAATSQDQAGLPPLQPTTYPINNSYNHGAPIWPTGMKEAAQEAAQECDFRHFPAKLKQDLVDPPYQTTSLPMVSHPTFPGHFQQTATAGSNSAYMENPNHQAISWNAASMPDPYQQRALKWSEVPTDLIPPTDPVRSNTSGPISIEATCQMLGLDYDKLSAELEEVGMDIDLALWEELERASDNRHRKRLRTAEMTESEDRDGVGPPNTSTKRRKITTERKTEDRVAAQTGETQEQRARRTSARQEYESKFGNRGLREETLAAPSQGVHPLFSPRPTTGATLGLTEFKDQAWAWMEGSERISEGTEDVHDKEVDEDRWTRLMVEEEDKWMCRACPGQTFFDKSTLRRHCKTVHGRECDRWKCWLCPDKSYSRKSGLDRHIKKKHQGGA